jgi:hypothetical protein
MLTHSTRPQQLLIRQPVGCYRQLPQGPQTSGPWEQTTSSIPSAIQFLRPDHRVGLRRPAPPQPGPDRRYTDPEPGAAPLPRRPSVRQTPRRCPKPSRPVRSSRRRNARPHRDATRRTPRAHHRRGRADRLSALAPHPRRETPQRPLHPTPPQPERTLRRLARPTPHKSAQRPAVQRPRPTNPTRTPRPRRSTSR